MKLTFVAMLAILLGLSCSPPCYAQGSWGLTAGGGFSKLVASNCRIEQVCNLDNIVGFRGGVFVAVPGSGQNTVSYAFQPELLFAVKGGKAVGGNVGQKLNYLEIPTLARVSVEYHNFRPFFLLGTSFGMRLSAKDDAGNDLKSYYHPVELGLVISPGVVITKKVGVQVRYQQSLFDQLTSAGKTYFGIANQPDKKTYNHSLTFLLDVNLGK